MFTNHLGMLNSISVTHTHSLRATLRQPDVELGQFKQILKTFLFGEAAAH